MSTTEKKELKEDKNRKYKEKKFCYSRYLNVLISYSWEKQLMRASNRNLIIQLKKREKTATT